MNITLVDTTLKKYRQFVPLALLRLSTMHKKCGDNVELVTAGDMPRRVPDKIYFSFIFLFEYKNDVRWVLTYRKRYPRAGIMIGGVSPTLIPHKFENYLNYHANRIEIFKGRDTEIEKLAPDFEITGYQYSYGFTTRGCPNKCAWCVVPKLEGKQNIIQDWQSHVNTKFKTWYAFDNNVLACGADHLENVLKFCHKNRIKLDFNQAMDAEIFHHNKKIPPIFIRYPHVWEVLRFAWDSDRVEESIIYVMDFMHLNGISANLKSLLMLYDADDSPEKVYSRIKIVLAHPAKFVMKLMRFKDLDTGVLLRKWGGIGDLFADALGFAITGNISTGNFWNYMCAGDLDEFLKKASYIREYLSNTDKKVSIEFIKFAQAKISNVSNVST